MPRYPFVVLGGGMVAGYLAQQFAGKGLARGALAIVSADDMIPYERPPLSKGYLAGQKQDHDLLINDQDFYDKAGIKVYLGAEATRVDLEKKELATAAGETIGYNEALIIATGARVRRLDLPGAALDGVEYLRTAGDARRIRERAAHARRAVVIGSGFIGMETAAVMKQRGLEVTMVYRDERIWQNFFTPEMSAWFERYYEERGVVLRPGSRLERLRGRGASGPIEAVVLADGTELAADLVIAGIGVEPVVDLFEGTGLKIHNGIEVNEFLETGVPGVYAAGDVANTYDPLFKKRRRVEHWDNAVAQGEYLARKLAGEHEPFLHVPYFFSDEFDLSYEFWGDISGADRVATRGQVQSGEFSTWWLREGQLVAAFVLNRPDEERELAQQWIRERTPVPAGVLEDEAHSLTPLI